MEKQIHHYASQGSFSSWLPWQTLSACQACSLEASLTGSSPSSTKRTRHCILLNAPLERVLYLPFPSHCCQPIQASTCSCLLDESPALPPHYCSMHLHLITPVSCPITSDEPGGGWGQILPPSVISSSLTGRGKQTSWATTVRLPCRPSVGPVLLFYLPTNCSSATFPVWKFWSQALPPYCPLSTSNLGFSASFQIFFLSLFGMPLDFLFYILINHLKIWHEKNISHELRIDREYLNSAPSPICSQNVFLR